MKDTGGGTSSTYSENGFEYTVRIVENGARRALQLSELHGLDILTTPAWVYDQKQRDMPWANTKAMQAYFKRKSLEKSPSASAASAAKDDEDKDDEEEDHTINNTVQFYAMVENDGCTVHIAGPRKILLSGVRPVNVSTGRRDASAADDEVVTLVVSPIEIVDSNNSLSRRNASLFHELSLADVYYPSTDKQIDIHANDTPMDVILRMLNHLAVGVHVPMVHARHVRDILCTGHDVNKPIIFAKSFGLSPKDEHRRNTIREMMGLGKDEDRQSPASRIDGSSSSAAEGIEEGGGGGQRFSPRVSLAAAAEPQVPITRDDVQRWSFDALALEKKVGGRCLTRLMMKFVDEQCVVQGLGIDRQKLVQFVTKVEEGYLEENPYHNAQHAVSALQATHMIMVHSRVADRLAKGDDATRCLLLLVAYVAAAVHDFRHCGVTNKFLIDASSPLAILYNDTSPHENHHLAAAFQLLRGNFYDFLDGMPKEDSRKFRNLVISMVLHTDMEHHFALLTRFKMRALVRPRWGDDMQDVTLVLQMVLKCADLSHLSYEFGLHKAWVGRLEEEMFLQGDKEMAIGLPISPLCDRTKQGITASQADFIDFVAIDMFKQFTDVFSTASPLLDGVVRNHAAWVALSSS